MNNHLHVWIYLKGEEKPVLCGVLELLQGRRCIFSYHQSWIGRANAFALSPDLPLCAGVIEPPENFDIHPVFEDAGPDRWGKNVINKVFNPLRRSPIEYLELAGSNRIGALGFSRSSTEFAVLDGGSFHSIDLPDLIRASESLSSRMPINDDMRRLLRPGSSAGGARPKSIIKYDGQDWIAKFQAEGDELDVCAVEHASLVLAKLCQIKTAETKLIPIGKQNALLVKRFDRQSDERVHFVSARTMLIAHGIPEGKMGYADIADIARRLSSMPEKDCHELFRRMVFNVFVENTDDHEKNHAFLYRHGQWELSPAYDVLPQIQGLGFHQLRIGKSGNEANIANMLSESERFLLKQNDAELIVNKIYEKVIDWRDVFIREGVSSQDVDLCANFILRAPIFQFGEVPKNFTVHSDQIYHGKIVAVNEQHLYQSVGRNLFVQHERAAFKDLTLPNSEMSICYQENKVTVTKHKTSHISSLSR